MKQYLKLLSIISLVLFLASCSTSKPKTSSAPKTEFNSKVNELKPGMTKQEVINILGNNYVVIRRASYDSVLKKSVEIIRFRRKPPEKDYSIRFANGRLYDISRI